MNKLLFTIPLLLALLGCRSSKPVLPPTLVTHTGKLQRMANTGHDLDPLTHQQRLQVGVEGDRLYQQARQAYLAGDYGTYVYKLNQARKRFSMLATPFAEELSQLNTLLDAGNELWAQQLAKQAEAQLADGSFEKAIDTLRQAALADPSRAAEFQRQMANVAGARESSLWNNLKRYAK